MRSTCVSQRRDWLSAEVDGKVSERDETRAKVLEQVGTMLTN